MATRLTRFAALTVAALTLATIVPAVTAADRNETSRVKFVSSVAGGRATLLDRRSGVAWDLGPVSDAAVSSDGCSVVVRQTATGVNPIRLLDGALAIAPGEAG